MGVENGGNGRPVGLGPSAWPCSIRSPRLLILCLLLASPLSRANESYRNVCGRQSAGSGVASTARGPPKPPGPSQEPLPGEASHTRMLGRAAAAAAASSAGAPRQLRGLRRWEPAVGPRGSFRSPATGREGEGDRRRPRPRPLPRACLVAATALWVAAGRRRRKRRRRQREGAPLPSCACMHTPPPRTRRRREIPRIPEGDLLLEFTISLPHPARQPVD